MIGEFWPQANLVGLWHLNGNSTDSSGNGNNGTDTDITYSIANGKFGQGAGFNGSTSFIDIANNPAWTSWTFAIWLKPSSLGSMAIISKDLIGVSNRTFSLELAADGTMSLFSWNTTDTMYAVSSSASAVAANQQYLLTGTWDTPNNKLSMYINGVLANTPATTSGNAKTDSTKITLGRQNTPGKYFAGSLDEVALFNRALSASEIKKWYTWSKGKYL